MQCVFNICSPRGFKWMRVFIFNIVGLMPHLKCPVCYRVSLVFLFLFVFAFVFVFAGGCSCNGYLHLNRGECGEASSSGCGNW